MFKTDIIGPPPLKPRPKRCLAPVESILESTSKNLSPHQSFRYVDRGPMLVTSQEIAHFHKLLEVAEIKEFLSRDYCRTYADK